MKNKKILCSIIGGAAILMPIAAVISCGSSNSKSGEKNHEDNNYRYAEDVIVSSTPKEITSSFGEGNIANPKKTRSIDQRNNMEYKTRMATGQPFSLHYHLEDLVNWKAGADADDAYNISTIPLQDRTLAGKILASQKDKQLQILAGLQENVNKTATGTVAKDSKEDRVFQMWSKVTSFVSWGGETSGGNICVPKGNDINAAHRNGVPLLGTVFFPSAQNGGGPELYEALSKKVGNTYPVADALIKMSKHFGFDGWFLNFEAPDNSVEEMKGFMKYFHDKMVSEKLFTVLYDYGYGNAFMQDPDNINFDTAALDYGSWDKTYGLPSEKLAYGYDYDANELSGQAGTYPGKYTDQNFWLYTYFKRHDITDGDSEELKLFDDVDGSRDPRAHVDDDTYSKWPGLSRHFQAHSPIVSREVFSSSFETGIGSSFYIGGESQKLGSALADEGFRNQGIQDVLPTYTWINDEYSSLTDFSTSTLISKPGQTITDGGKDWNIKIDETGTPLYGSSNLHYSGHVTKGNTLINRLYGSNVKLKTGDEFSIVTDETDADLGLALWTQDIVKTDEVVSHATNSLKAEGTPTNLGNGLKKLTFKIPANLNNKAMISFGLSFSDSSDMNIDGHVEQITFNPIGQVASTENKITEVNEDGNFLFANERNVRINWKMQNDALVDHYVIWSTKGSSQDDFTKEDILSVTALPAAYLKNVAHNQTFNIVIDAVDSENKIISSNKVAVKTTFKKMNDKSKWTETFTRPTDDDATWIKKTGHGYTTSFKDEDGNIFFGDDFSRIHKITSTGEFLTDSSDDWGKNILGGVNHQAILKIWTKDADNICVLTGDGTIFTLNKNTGIKQGTPSTILKDNLKASISRLDLFSVDSNGTITVAFEVDPNTHDYMITRIDSDETLAEIPNQAGNLEVKIKRIAKNKDGTIGVVFEQDGKMGTTEFTDVSSIDFSKLKVVNDITEKLKEFANSDTFKGQFDPDFITGGMTFDDLAGGSILLYQKLSNGESLIVNSWGLAATLNKDGSVKAVTSVAGKNTWVEVAGTGKMVDADSNLFMYGILGLNGWISPIQFDESGKSLVFVVKTGADYNGSLKIGLSKHDMTDLLAGTTTVSAPETVFGLIPNDPTKKVGDVMTIQYENGIYVVGGHDGSVAFFDDDLKQLAIGEKHYSYDDKLIQSIDSIYDDHDNTIPKELMN